ncbi:MurR/RpiR family transcriptional regulator [Anaerorhabdus sp.]|uniref:MurR/RpiR family transcriptional regulator n=1 Tax=Anaerorhabdus sp. TaxID=1872524 RepID=UPI002B208CCE|nr:MurR/RpiR family transcriptional regulator [Anaerorhabdus sp.]MEA4875378.1 MurR/RpiR family transcriptional regulator [Anaerorhabdus sp.]
MSILITLREYRNLPEAENQVRDYLLKNSKEIIDKSIYELAEKTYTSPATIVRLCKKLGVKGFSQLKIQIASEIKAFDTIHLDILDTTSIAKNDSVKQIIDKITNISIQSIEETRILLDEKKLLNSARELMKASVIDFYGVGASNTVAFDAAYKFMRIGKSVSCFQLSDRQIVQAINSDKNHVGVLFSYSGETREIIEMAKTLQDNAVTTIAITCSTKSTLADLCDFALFVSSKETIFRSGAMSSRTAQLYIVDILYSICTSLDYDRSVKNVNKTRIISK